jgi:hypothetical protein
MRDRPGNGAEGFGYSHPRYAHALREFGTPLELSHCRGWVIERRIPGFADTDAMGCYPLFSCHDWSRLHLDLDELAGRLVSLTLVTDPFGAYDEPTLRRCFPDLALPFKQHYAIDLEKPKDIAISTHHRREARRALRKMSVQIHPNPPEFLDTWMALHSHLIARHHVKGIAAFSRESFAEQLVTPGMLLFTASLGGEPVAATLVCVQDEVVHGHIITANDVGYQQGAFYALIWSVIEHFSGSARWYNLMGVPGGKDAGSDRIREYKEGWTTETRTAWLCGRILDPSRYAAIARATGTSGANYFPAYRDGEMTGDGERSAPSDPGSSEVFPRVVEDRPW